MKRLIRLQVRNIFHNKLFYICLGLTLLAPFLSTLITKEKTLLIPEIASFLNAEISFIGIIFIAVFCCYDFSDGTTKNIIGRGYTRNQFLFSKYVACAVGLFTMYLAVVLLDVILYAKNGIGYDATQLYMIINSIFSIIAYIILFATASVLLEKNGSSIIACLFVPNLIGSAILLIDSKMKLNIGDYWIDAASSRFFENPTLNNLLISILYFAVYSCLFIFIGTRIFKKKEIK